MLSNLSGVVALSLAASITVSAAKPHLVVFGNSLSDIGNVENLSTDIPYWNRRFSNGPVWNEYLAYFNNYTLINFAIGGATSNNTSVKKFTNKTVEIPSALEQIGLFSNTFGGKFEPSTMKDDIAVIEIGGNDLLSGVELEAALKIDVEAFASSVAGNIVDSVKIVKGLGYKKIIVTAVSDISDIPATSMLSESSSDNVSKYPTAINDKLDSLLNSEFSANNSTDFIRLINLNQVINIIADNFKDQLNITVTDEPCYVVSDSYKLLSVCNNSDNYVFTDSVHPSTKTHALLASIIAQAVNNTSFEINEKSVEPLISRYNLTNANSRSNFLYDSDSYSTGKVKIESYTIKSAILNANAIIATKNSQKNTSSDDENETNTTKSDSKSDSKSSAAFTYEPMPLISAIFAFCAFFFSSI
ncbi:hypothetical protein BB561_003638 [Smittium simulii]|uniref:SGNH hydrolase-type esterase domain-containing protein n=1 Tax=Smittium simulii TaxID=133385 RepID=A0A2T9YK68_9FUNG|nr:hypothetical protein BB561_003638 [Smittium simulii]